jgi:hypothetical protein
MVGERSSRDGKSVADLGKLRHHLRRQVYAYVGSIGTLYKVDNPESAEIVENALRPILIAREQARRTALGLIDEVIEDEDEDELDDEAEAEAVESEETELEPLLGPETE